jgi:superfamily II DNA helicase RecQ
VEEAAPEPVKGKKKRARPEAVEIPAALKEWRAALAKKLKVPAFAILPDKTLAALVAARPGDEEEMLDVHGMGPAKVKRFGAELLVLLRELE